MPEEARQVIEETVRRTSRSFSSVANEMLSEAARMRRVPGIVFSDGPAGRRAQIAGTGLDVWEVIQSYKGCAEHWERLKTMYDWLDDRQLRSALAYYEAYPAEIDERLEHEEGWTPEQVYARHPFVRPPWRAGLSREQRQ
jgi:uncharacterized protein (DUF433 family)